MTTTPAYELPMSTTSNQAAPQPMRTIDGQRFHSSGRLAEQVNVHLFRVGTSPEISIHIGNQSIMMTVADLTDAVLALCTDVVTSVQLKPSV